jgi:hypothetical protein
MARNKLALITVLCVLVLPTLVGSANVNVSLEIYRNSNDEYYVSIGGGELQECLTGYDGNLTNDLSANDIQAIARRTAIELSLQNIKLNTTTNNPPPLNETTLKSILNNIIEEKQANDRAWIMKTWMPTTQDYQNCTLQLKQKDGALATLDAKFAGYDATLEARQAIIDGQNRELEMSNTIIAILLAALFLVFVSKSELVKTILEYRRTK